MMTQQERNWILDHEKTLGPELLDWLERANLGLKESWPKMEGDLMIKTAFAAGVDPILLVAAAAKAAHFVCPTLPGLDLVDRWLAEEALGLFVDPGVVLQRDTDLAADLQKAAEALDADLRARRASFPNSDFRVAPVLGAAAKVAAGHGAEGASLARATLWRAGRGELPAARAALADIVRQFITWDDIAPSVAMASHD